MNSCVPLYNSQIVTNSLSFSLKSLPIHCHYFKLLPIHCRCHSQMIIICCNYLKMSQFTLTLKSLPIHSHSLPVYYHYYYYYHYHKPHIENYCHRPLWSKKSTIPLRLVSKLNSCKSAWLMTGGCNMNMQWLCIAVNVSTPVSEASSTKRLTQCTGTLS